MKNFFRSLIKILYVVILPIAFIVSASYVVSNYEVTTTLLVVLVLLGTCIVANAVMYLVFMSRVKMLPKVHVDLIPIFGFAFGVDPHDSDDTISWILLIPFVSFEFRSKK